MLSALQRRIGSRVIIAYLLAVLLIVGIGILAVARLGQISATVDDLTNDLAVERALADDIVSQVLLVRFYANRYVRTQDQADLDQFNTEFNALEALLHQAEGRITDAERMDLLSRIEPAVAGYGDTFDRVAELIVEQQRIQSEILSVQELTVENRLTALRMHVISLNEPPLFLSFGNAQNAFQQMRLNATRYLETGDERFVVLFDRGYQQAQSAFGRLEATLSDPTQQSNASEAKTATNAYQEGFHAIREGQIELKNLFATKLDVLEPEISNAAMGIASSVEREFKTQNAFSQRLIAQTRIVLLTTTGIATLAALGLGLVISRYLAERAESERALQKAHDRLEQRVRERTAELRTANKKLQAEVLERKLAEKRLERYAAELKQANEEVKHFAYIVSHDLRAPLVNLKGFSTELRFALEEVESVLDDVLPHLDDEQRQTLAYAMDEDVPEALGFIESSVSRMDHFISAVLKLSRMGRRELELEPLDVEAIVNATLETLAHQIEERQVRVTVGDLPEVVADRTSMEQVIGNIVSNAVKYLDPSRPGRIEIAAERNHDETIFHIRDNGRGIAQDDMHKVFAPFRQAGRQNVQGEGMGLAYVQTLIRRHGGRIWCESELDRGTVFHFTISNDVRLDTSLPDT